MMSGAAPARAFWSITLRMALPALCALTLLIFVRAFESFEVPALVGLAGNINVMTTTIYQTSHTTGAPNHGQAGAYSVCLILIVIGLLFWQNQLSRHAHRYQTVTGKGFRPRVVDLGKWRYFAATALFALFAVVTILPISMLIFTSLLPFYEGVTTESFARLSLDNYKILAGPGSFRDSIANTLVLGVGTASFVVPFTALCAWLVARRARGAWLLDQLCGAPLVFPAIVMAVAMLELVLNQPFPLYGTLLSIIIASAIHYLPYGMRYSYAGILQIHRELEEAAAMSGARQATIFLRIVVPLIAPALVACALFIFLVAVKAVSIPILLSGPKSRVVAVALFDMWQNGLFGEVCAIGVVWTAFMTIVSLCFFFLLKRFGMAMR